MESPAEAAMQGHYLGPIEPVDEPGLRKYEAFCQKCGKSVKISHKTLYSNLADECPGMMESYGS